MNNSKTVLITGGETYTHVEIEYIITPGRNGTKMSGVLSSDFTGEFDRDYYWTNKTQPVLERITEVAFPGEEIFEPKPKKVRLKKVVDKDGNPKVAKTKRASVKEKKLKQQTLF